MSENCDARNAALELAEGLEAKGEESNYLELIFADGSKLIVTIIEPVLH